MAAPRDAGAGDAPSAAMGAALAGLVAWVLLLRGPAFPVTVLDWDESMYFMQARELLRGNWIYDTLWDFKPVGIVLLFAGAMATLGEDMLSVRILAALFVLGTSMVIFRLVVEACRSRPAALLAAFAYPAYTTGMGGMASNTEIFFATPLALAMLVAWRGVARSQDAVVSHGTAAAAGTCLGLALSIKTVVVVEALAVGAFLFLRPALWRDGHGRRHLLAALTYGVCLSGPYLLTAGVFALGGRFDDFLFANVTAQLAYVQDAPPSWRILYGLKHGLRPLAPLLLVLVMLLVYRRWRGGSGAAHGDIRELRALGGLWLVATCAGIVAMAQWMPHYFVSLAAPLCVGLGWAAHATARAGVGERARRPLLLALLVLLLGTPLMASARNHLRRYADNGYSYVDTVQRVADHIRTSDGEHRPIYVVDTEFIIHHLADAPFLTRHLFPAHLLWPNNWPLTGGRGTDEIERIFAAGPEFVVITARGHADGPEESLALRVVRRHLDHSYELERRIGDVLVFRRQR